MFGFGCSGLRLSGRELYVCGVELRALRVFGTVVRVLEPTTLTTMMNVACPHPARLQPRRSPSLPQDYPAHVRFN